MAKSPKQGRIAPGIIERTSSTGDKSYVVRVRIKGHQTQTKTFHRLTDAKKWQRHARADIEAGRTVKPAEAARHIFAELAERYLADVMPGKPLRTRKIQTAQLQYWVSCFGNLALSEITPALIGEQRDKLARQTHYRHTTYCKTTLNRYLAILSHVFSVAVRDYWYWLEENPVLKVRKAKEDNARVRFLSDTEREALLSACRSSPNQHLYPAVILALSTGMRQMEILSLTWADVDLARGRIILQETKNGDRRSVPLVGHAKEIIMALGKVRRIDTRLIFPSRNNTPASLRKPWEEALAMARVEDFRFHDLRHTAASYLAMNGASLLEIAEILGHKTLQMVKRYADLADSHTAQVVERMNQAVFK